MTMARRTADAFFYVNAVIEVDKVRKIVNANPFDRLATAKARPHWFEVRTVGPDLFVTVHARRGWWYARVGRRFH